MSLNEFIIKFRKRAWEEFWKHLPASIYMVCTYFIVLGYNKMDEGYTDLKNKLNTIQLMNGEISEMRQWHVQDSIYKSTQILKYADIQKWDYDQDRRADKQDSRIEKNENNLSFALQFINSHK